MPKTYRSFLTRGFVIAILVSCLAACATTSVTSPPDTTGYFKLSTVKVQWAQFNRVFMEFPKDGGKEYAQAEAAPLIETFVKQGPAAIEQQLAQNGVPAGNAWIVELSRASSPIQTGAPRLLKLPSRYASVVVGHEAR